MRKERPGAPLSQADADGWKAKSLRFVAKRKAADGASAEVAVKRRKTLARVERLASYDWLMALHNSMKACLGSGLERCLPDDPLAEVGSEMQDGRKIPQPLMILCDQNRSNCVQYTTCSASSGAPSRLSAAPCTA